MFWRIFALVIKEFLALLKDPKSRTVLIGPPVFQVLVFGYAATFDVNRVALGVYAEDHGQPARQLVAAFEASPSFQRVMTIAHDAEIAPALDSQRVLAVLHIGPTFSADLRAGRPAQAQLLLDGRNSNTALIVLGYGREVVLDFNRRFAEAAGLHGPPASLRMRAWYNQNLQSRWFIVPGIVALLTLVVTMLVTALSVAREREQGTFDQLLVTPLRPLDILLGKLIPGFVIGLLEATAIILVAVWWFDIPLRGHVFTLYAGTIAFLLSALGVGLMISSLSTTQQQGLLGAFLFLVPAIILSGFATPIANMPPLVQDITLLNPMRYFLVVLRGVFLEGTPIELLIEPLVSMSAIGVVTLTAAAWLFRHRMA